MLLVVSDLTRLLELVRLGLNILMLADSVLLGMLMKLLLCLNCVEVSIGSRMRRKELLLRSLIERRKEKKV